jgi:hypothetical protein
VTLRRGHGWWPYLVPVFAFLLLGELGARLPASLVPWLLPVRVLVPARSCSAGARGPYPLARRRAGCAADS